MRWHHDSITEGEIEALYETARHAWDDSTRYPIANGLTSDAGQCYTTASWLQKRLGGHIGKRGGHYAWLSPGGEYILDLATHNSDRYVYEKNSGYIAVEAIPNDRTEKFYKRANTIFESLGGVLRLSVDNMGDALPAGEPQRSAELAQEEDQTKQYFHDEPNFEPAQGTYQFVYANDQLEVSPDHDHEQLLAHTGVGKDHSGPMAMGHISLANNRATWEASSNMNVSGLDKIFKEYTKHVGWDWGGITNAEGEPISDEFSPKKSEVLHFVYDQDIDHLWIGHDPIASLAIRSSNYRNGDGPRPEGNSGVRGGAITIRGHQATVSFYGSADARSIQNLYDFCADRDLILYSGNDNLLKTVPDLQEHNLYDPNPDNPGEHQFPAGPMDEREPSGIYRCPVCQRLFPGWAEYADHRRQEADDAGEPIQDGKFPEPDPDSTTPPAHFTPQQPEMMPLGCVMPSTYREASRVDGFRGSGDGQYFVGYKFGSPVAYAKLTNGKLVEAHSVLPEMLGPLHATVIRYSEKEPKDLLTAPIPFIYDIEEDEIVHGQPGQRTSEIPGQFTPGGIVEGTYEPGGKVIIRTSTNMPYSVRHLIDLWYYQHPELSVTGVFLQEDSGSTTKLAADAGGTVSSMVAADPTVKTAADALEADGGKVYAVGGAVRDALMGKEPKDIDLMVSGLDPMAVQLALEDLPGRVDLTGKSFGVFRYRNQGKDVEIALPRREHSTGEGHRDFDVQADPNLSPKEDLYRRDFSANAMAVDLSNGNLIDPYGGASDIQNGVLRAHNPNSLSEDPLRVVRALVANARHGLVPEDNTKQQMAENATSLTHLPPERIQAELDKLFAADEPAKAIRLAHETGVLNNILPEVERAFGYDQNNPHHEHELGEHLTNVLDRTSEINKDPDVRLAALLHDIGKPDSAWVDPEYGTNHYYEKRLDDGTMIGADHENVGAKMTNALMNRLRYPNDRTKRVTDLVKHHMFPAFTSEKGARKFVNKVGDQNADDLLDMRWGDQGGKSEYPSNENTGLDLSVDTQRKLLEQVRQEGQPTNQAQLAINGNDLIGIGIPPGPQMGQLLQRLTDAVIDNPTLNQRDTLLQLAQDNVT